jgi:putative peptide zinc metalloprotease protein
VALPLLREELALHPGPSLADGQPSWTLHDPVRNQFFRIDWLTFAILSRWPLNDAHAITERIAAETTLQPDLDDIEAVIYFLAENQLIQPGAQSSAADFAARFKKMRGSWGHWLLHHYLFFRVPLVKPDRWLTRLVDKVAVFYTPAFFRLTLVVLLVGLIMVYRDWGRFSATLVDMFTWAGLAGYAFTLIGVKVLHELGHAFTAKRYGCRVPVMGIAFLVLWPVAYTDTNEVWKLADRRQRLAVAAAGVTTELIIAVWATLAWALLPEGLPKAVAFMLATTTWVVTVALNSSPFMRFDGYFLLSDWLEMPNLHSRAFALARWHLRERLFDLGEPPPERFPPKRERGLILFAYGTWIYRLVLFLGIAVLVYHFFVKAVGILLFVVEIGWFILLPLWSEIKAWRERWELVRMRPRAKRTMILASLVVAFMVIPWPTRISSSGILRPAEIYPVYAPEGAQVTAVHGQEGNLVPAGQPMIQLASPELELRWRKATARLEGVRWQAVAAGIDARQRQNLQILQEELATAQAEMNSVQTTIEKYAPRAPFDGQLRDLDPDLKPGVWVGRGERLAVLVQTGKWRIETYLDEEALRHIKVGDGARFYTDGMEGPFLPLTVVTVDRDATRVLTNGMLAAQFGGSVITREKQGQLIPERAVYRVTLATSDDPGKLAGHSWRGTVVIRGAWEAPGLSFLRAALALLWREAGF